MLVLQIIAPSKKRCASIISAVSTNVPEMACSVTLVFINLVIELDVVLVGLDSCSLQPSNFPCRKKGMMEKERSPGEKRKEKNRFSSKLSLSCKIYPRF